MRWYIIIGTILMAIILTACSVNANAGNSDAETAIVKNENASQTYEGNGNLTTETDGMDTDRMITIAQDYVISNLMGYDGAVIDIENPTIEIIDELPGYYHHISDISDKEGGYYKVTFTTNLDDLLGPIGVYMDNAGNVIGSDYRE